MGPIRPTLFMTRAPPFVTSRRQANPINPTNLINLINPTNLINQ